MAARYTVNGQEMSEEEFRNFTNGANAFGDSGFWNFQDRRNQRRWDHKPHLYQCYKDTPQGLWNEISFDDFKRDIDKQPKYKKEFWYVQSINGEYIIQSSPVVAIFYDHFKEIFLYMKADGVIAEHNCFKSEQDAMDAILNLENEKCGEHKLFSADGQLIMKWKPTFDNDSSIENTIDFSEN